MKNKIGVTVVSLLTVCALSACAGTKNNATEESSTTSSSKHLSVEELNKVPLPQLDDKVTSDEDLVEIQTEVGNIEIRLFPKYAPLAVENFMTHAKDGYYNGTVFHRVMKDFMIQGGDPKGDGTGGESIWKGKNKKIDSGNGFKLEISPSLYNISGSLSMANAGPDTNGSQFFINSNHNDVSGDLAIQFTPKKIIEAYKKGGNPSLDGSYTVFGQVTKGMDIVEKIQNAKTKMSASGEDSDPEKPVKIKDIKILQEAK